VIYLPVSFPILFIPFMLFSFISEEPLLGLTSPPAYILIPSAFFMMF